MNIYYRPKEFGLEAISALDEPDMSYEFNMLVSWLHKDTGRVFWAQSRGCSCPSPFEEYHFRGPDDTNINELTHASRSTFEKQVDDFPIDFGNRDKFKRHSLYVAGLTEQP